MQILYICKMDKTHVKIDAHIPDSIKNDCMVLKSKIKNVVLRPLGFNLIFQNFIFRSSSTVHFRLCIL